MSNIPCPMDDSGAFDTLYDVPLTKIAILERDIAYAIGRFEGLGYPSEYLKRKYPHLASLDQASNNGTGHAQVCTDQVDYPL